MGDQTKETISMIDASTGNARPEPVRYLLFLHSVTSCWPRFMADHKQSHYGKTA